MTAYLCELRQILVVYVSTILQSYKLYLQNRRPGSMLQQAFKHLFIALTLFVLIFSARTLAEDSRGEVVGINGCVYVSDASGERTTVEEAGMAVREADTVVTGEGSSAIIRFNDGVLSVLDEKSRLRVEKTSWLSHLGGRVYFTFRKVFGGKRQITTRFATLGIRGTTFIVYDDDSGQGVALQEGVLDIESDGEAFELYKQQRVDEFEAFKQQRLQQQQELGEEFDDYKQQLQHEFIEYRDSFTLQPDTLVRFDGTRVIESRIDDSVKETFEDFEMIAGELLEEFREQSQQHREMLENKQVLDEEDFYE